jgi:predicted site-specific integrase-resolvase
VDVDRAVRASETIVVYARVSFADQRADIDRQVARLTEWATGQQLVVSRVVTEVGSVLDGHCKEFLAPLRDPSRHDDRGRAS